jgi:hypothetical protein
MHLDAESFARERPDNGSKKTEEKHVVVATDKERLTGSRRAAVQN